MKFGISSYVWVSPFSDETIGLLEKVKKMGFDCIEICVEDPATIHPRNIKPALLDLDLGVLVCGAFGPGRDVSSEDGAVRQKGVEYLLRCVDIAYDLDAGMVSGPMYSATGKARLLSSDEKERQWDWAVTNLQTCAQYARQNGIKLAIEPLNRFETDFINTVDQGLDLLDRIGCENAGLLLDTFHMNIEEIDMADSIRKARNRVFNFHACSNTRGIPGEDHIDWESIAAALKDTGFKGPIVIESFTDKITEIARAVSLWRPLAASQDELAQKGIAFLKDLFA